MALNFGLLDTSIPAQIGAMPGNALAARRQRIQQDEDRSMGREHAQMQNALARMQMTKAQGDMDEEAAYKNALRGVQGGDYKAAMPGLMQASPTRAMALQKQMSEQQKGDMEMTLKRFEIIDRAAGQFAANPTRQSAMQSLQMLQSIGTPPEVLQQMQARLEQTPDEQLPQLAREFLASTQEGIKAQTERLFPKAVAPSEFERTMDAAGMSPEERQAAARARVAQQTTHRPPSMLSVTMPLEKEEGKEKGRANVALYGEIRNGAAVARKLNAQLESQSRTLDSGFETGFGTKWKASAAAALGALGVQDAEQYATNAQTFNAAAKEVVLQKQLAQKGPQTESDAKRIEETGTQMGSTPQANRFILDIARAQNDRDIKQQQFFDKYWRENKTYEGAEDAWYAGDGGRSLFDDPRLKKYGQQVETAPRAVAPSAEMPGRAGPVSAGQIRQSGGAPSPSRNITVDY